MRFFLRKVMEVTKQLGVMTWLCHFAIKFRTTTNRIKITFSVNRPHTQPTLVESRYQSIRNCKATRTDIPVRSLAPITPATSAMKSVMTSYSRDLCRELMDRVKSKTACHPD